jgi:hypothetical protein
VTTSRIGKGNELRDDREDAVKFILTKEECERARFLANVVEEMKMFELIPSGWLWCDVCGENKEWGFEAKVPSLLFQLDLVFSVCQRCVRQHDQIDGRLRESAARLVEEADQRRDSQEADYFAHEAAKLRYFIGRIKAPSDAEWKALEVAKMEAESVALAWLESQGLPPEPPEADAEYDDPGVPSAADVANE